MNFHFIKSPHRFYYFLASIRFMKSPWKIYEITHFDGYLADTKSREIHDDYCNYRSSHKYNK